jgi:hypothetical protein
MRSWAGPKSAVQAASRPPFAKNAKSGAPADDVYSTTVSGGLPDDVATRTSDAANNATISAGTLDQLNDYCSARGRAKFVADWVPGGGTMARTLWGSNNGAQLGFYQLSTADLNNITGENRGGRTVRMHVASEGLKAASGSTAFLSWFRGATGVPKTLASTWLGRLSVALIVADASSGFYKEYKEILNCQAGN